MPGLSQSWNRDRLPDSQQMLRLFFSRVFLCSHIPAMKLSMPAPEAMRQPAKEASQREHVSLMLHKTKDPFSVKMSLLSSPAACKHPEDQVVSGANQYGTWTPCLLCKTRWCTSLTARTTQSLSINRHLQPSCSLRSPPRVPAKYSAFHCHLHLMSISFFYLHFHVICRGLNCSSPAGGCVCACNISIDVKLAKMNKF